MADAYYEILGSVTVRREAGAAPIALSDQHRLLLARLLLEPGVRVSTAELIDALWEEASSANPRNSLQVAVRAVRGLLGDTDRVRRVLVTDGDGYRLVVGDALHVDAERFRRLARRGHDFVAERPTVARAMLGEALSLWQGPLFGGLGERDWALGHRHELESIRDGAEVDLNEVRLALGEHGALEGALRRQIASKPFDERRRGQLIRLLDRLGRSAEAQLEYRTAYRELGAVGPQLRAIGRDVARGAAARAAAARADAAARAATRLEPHPVLLCAVRHAGAEPGEHAGLGLLSLVVDDHGGVPAAVGDELLLATFPDADRALRAAAAIAAAGPARASVGVHRGAIVALGDALAGPGPARCRQLARAAHPGQVLVTADACADAGGADELLDLGEHRFVDLGPAVRVFELATGPDRFPPPRTLSRLPHNLPVQATRFVGRADELATLARVVAGGELVTLTGPGGCGKTRLALQLAATQVEAFAEGAWFIELAEIAPGTGAEAVAAAIGQRLGVRALPGEAQLDALVRHLSDRRALLVLDNCEQIHAACGELAALLRDGCRGVCVVATSRRPLRVDGEHVLSVASMATARASSSGLPSDAVELLLERAGPLPGSVAGDETLALAVRICRALDGLPLAVELAAAQVPLRGLDGVATEVEAMMRGGDGLTRYANDDPGRPGRQRTIQAAIEWSYRLLGDRERRVLRRLAVFHGSFGVAEALRVVAVEPDGDAVLQQLVDSSVVAAAPPVEGVPRLRLVEPIRAFALHLLERAGELEDAAEAHAGTFLELAAASAPRLFGPDEQGCLLRLAAEHDNLIAALAWHVDHGRAVEALRLVGALWWLWFSHGHLEVGCAWVERALALDGGPSRERVRALRAGSHLAWWRGDHAQCDAHNVALEACAREIGDEWGLAWVLMGFGATQVFRDPLAALPMFEDSKRRFDALGRPWEAGYTLHLIGGARWFGGDVEAAHDAFAEAVEIFGRLGHRSVLASVQRCAGLMAARCGNVARGTALCADALRLSDAIGDRAGSAQALNFLAAIARDEDDLPTTVIHHAEALRLARQVGDLWATCWALDGLAGAARELGEPAIAARLLGGSAALAARSWYMPSPRERELRDADLDALRVALGDADLEQGLAEGGLMGVGEVVSCALAFAARHADADELALPPASHAAG